MRMLLVLLIAGVTTAAAARLEAGEPLKAMTFNVRLASAADGDHVWAKRSDLALKVIEDEDPAVLGVQEAQRVQMDFLAKRLPDYVSVGVGREADGGGEFSALFFKRKRFDLSDAGTFWLSDTPTVPGSRSWGNNLPRIATWARLFDRKSGDRIVVINTHWDHESQPARLNSGRLMAERSREWIEAGDPVIAMGDFNAAPKNPAIVTLLEEGGPLRDSFFVAHPKEKEISTFNGFGRTKNSPKIDAILVSPQWEVEKAEIVRTRDGDRFPSDHYPVTATLRLPNDKK